CVYEPVAEGTGCGDDDACNGVEVCAAGSCVREPAPVCDDGDPCTTDTCEAPGRCVSTFACAPVPPRGPARCQLGFVGLPVGPCTDGDPGCDGDHMVDGTCRFDVVLCVGDRSGAQCGAAAPATAIVPPRGDRSGMSALADLMAPHLPATVGACVGPLPLRVTLRGRSHRARVRVPLLVTTADGHRLRARVRLVCRAAGDGASHRLPDTG